MPIVITDKVREGILAVRNSGALNMFDYHGVMKMADSLGFAETVNWMYSHKKEYAEGIFQGFTVPEETILN